MKTIACLAGDGVGPELMAAATRALDGVAELHSLQLDDVHLPFGGEGVTRSGHPLPRRDARRLSQRRRDPRRVARRARARGREGRPRARLARRPVSCSTAPAISSWSRRSDEWANCDRARPRVRVRRRAARPRALPSASPPTGGRPSRPSARAGAGSRSRRRRSAQALVRLRERPESLDVVVDRGAARSTRSSTPRRTSPARRRRSPMPGCPNDGPGVFVPGACGAGRGRRLRRRRPDAGCC